VHKSAPVTLTLGAACLLLAIAGEPLASSLAWQRGAILHGEVWRLWSGHLVHYSPSHGAADALALLAAGMLAEPLAGSRRFAALLVGGAALISLGLLACVPALDAYRGASGLAMLAAALAGVLLWRRRPAARWLLGAAGLALAVKLLGDAGGHALTLADLPAGVEVSWQAHLLGALLGAGAAAWIDRRGYDAGWAACAHNAWKIRSRACPWPLPRPCAPPSPPRCAPSLPSRGGDAPAPRRGSAGSRG
jgi:rhomboid family GlyGly-CTERM serine protease